MESNRVESRINGLYRRGKQTRQPDEPAAGIPMPKVGGLVDEESRESRINNLYHRYKRKRTDSPVHEQREVVDSKSMSLSTKIVIPMLLGVLVGLGFHVLPASFDGFKWFFVEDIFNPLGTLFIALFKMMVVPLVFVSLVSSVASFGSLRSLGRIGVKSTVLFLVTSTIAVSVALTLAVWLQPGQGQVSGSIFATGLPSMAAGELNHSIIPPANIVKAMAEGHVLGVIVFALLFGAAIRYSGENGRHVLGFFRDLDNVVQTMLSIIMKLAPMGSFVLLAALFASEGIALVRPLLEYMGVVIMALIIHSFATYGVMLKWLGSLSPVTFIRKIPVVNLFAFFTASSNATIPLNMKNVRESMGVDESMTSFVIPLGATMNMDGTAIMQGVAAVFIANVYQIPLGIEQYLAIIISTVVASIGTAGIPAVGLAMLAIVLDSAGIPTEGIALIIGVDRILDMLRTAVNVTGDAVVTCVVARSEKAMDLDIYKDPVARMKTLSIQPL